MRQIYNCSNGIAYLGTKDSIFEISNNNDNYEYKEILSSFKKNYKKDYFGYSLCGFKDQYLFITGGNLDD